MMDLIASGRIVDLILVLVALECAGLWAMRRFAGIGPGLVAMLPNLAAGACLLMALRAGLTGAGAMAIGFWLATSFGAHLADLAVRWRR